ncbi:TrmH family RNA methyltransferase [Uliginosibacterium gangwonense]|uniref:TrmH family RNA methyltransferase n=1 Tax=Uliginosibacterium gangwonense TaxID=392736 RepID=UPI00037C6BEF|nr:RNA methyltransferase [Uliginosibacterium gangwonense]
MKFISSRDNPTFKHLRALNEDARYRREQRASVLDGDHLLLAALEAGWPLKRLVLREDVVDTALAQQILARTVQQPPEEVLVFSAALFKVLSPVQTPTGLLAEIAVPADLQASALAQDVLALAGVQDAGNLGTLLRTAVAAGVREVWLDRHTTHAWSPKALRAGMGAQFQLRIVDACDLAASLAVCPLPSYVTSLGRRSESLYALDLRQPGIWVFGAEGQGVPAELIAQADHEVRIPMPGVIESLNVAAAAAVCLFEQVRQRL